MNTCSFLCSTSEEFRKDYCRLWKAMVLTDQDELARICRSWGVADSEFFASLQLLKPYTPKKGGVHLNATTREDVLKFQVGLIFHSSMEPSLPRLLTRLLTRHATATGRSF